MIVAGAKGLAGELLEILSQRKALTNLYFFDNISAQVPEKFFNMFQIIRTFDAVREVFNKTADPSFCLGLGNPVLRYRICQQFMDVGGVLSSVISPKAEIGAYGTRLGDGCCILPGVVITSSVSIGKGCLLNPNATISHDSELGDYVEVSPGVNVTGNCRVGNFSFLGSNSVILPRINVGKNVMVGAGAVVTRDVPDNCVVAGVPAIVKRTHPPLDI